MKPQYEPKTITQALGYLIEEAGEVQAAVGKSIRWGLDSVNPELPPEQRIKNAHWLFRELADLEGAIGRARRFLGESGYRPLPYPPGMGEESRRLHREYAALEAAQRNGAKNGAEVCRVTEECAAKGIILVPGGENL